MNPMINPMMMLMQGMRSGQNPQAILAQMAQLQNPQVAQVMQMMQGKNPQQLQQMAESMAKEKNIDLNQVMRSLGINNASFR